MTTLLEKTWPALGLAEEGVPAVTLAPGPDVLPSRLAVREMLCDAVGLVGLALGHTSVRVDPVAVAATACGDRLVRVDDRAGDPFAPLSGFWQTADGWVRTHANYPHHRAALTRALDLPDDVAPAGLRAVLSHRSAADVEAAVTAAGGIATEVLTEETWRGLCRGHDAPSPLTVTQVHEPTSAGERTVRRHRPDGARGTPLAGVRVLDLTRVIAGPVATRTLALLGADVLRIDPPDRPELPLQWADNGMGKRSATADLADPGVRRRVAALVERADIVVCGYRPGALAAYGLGVPALLERRPGLVVATLDAWGEGPRCGRRGFDSIVQAASGIAWIESADGERPGALPCQALDHTAGYLLAAGILAALRTREDNGAGRVVSTSLAALARHLLDGPRRDRRPDADPAAAQAVTARVVDRDTPLGRLTYPLPAVPGAPADYPRPGPAYAASDLTWDGSRHTA